jgi:ubiquitin-like 1-activating enzyme E1 B
MIESGTAGMLGQSRMIIPDVSECFDCRAHPVPTTYPICTIRSTPTLPVHCVIWAKEHLFPAIFSPSSSFVDTEIDFGVIEDESTKENLSREQNFLRQLNKIGDPDEQADSIIDVIFGKEIEFLASLKELWAASNRPLPIRIDKEVCDKWQAMLRATISSLKKRNREIFFDKDDDDVMEFVAAAANLRAYCFGIPEKSVFDIKAIAGNIIPAISTTNAIAATLAVNHMLNYLEGTDGRSLELCKTIYIANTDKILSFEKGNSPNPNCSVCCTHRAVLRLSPKLLSEGSKVSTILELLKENFTIDDLDDLQLRIDNRIIYDAFELDQNSNKSFSEVGIQDGIVLTADIGNIPVMIAIISDERCSDKVKFEVLKKINLSKRIKLEEDEASKPTTPQSEGDIINLVEESDDLEIL